MGGEVIPIICDWQVKTGQSVTIVAWDVRMAGKQSLMGVENARERHTRYSLLLEQQEEQEEAVTYRAMSGEK